MYYDMNCHSVMKKIYRKKVHLFKFNVAFHEDTTHLICSANDCFLYEMQHRTQMV